MSFLINPFAFAVAGGDFESIATVTVGSGGASEIEFTSIPATYQHLQIRGVLRGVDNGAGGNERASIVVRLNGDTGSNYTYHALLGNGSSASAGALSSQTATYPGFYATNTAGASEFAAVVGDILDYGVTTKYKTMRAISGHDGNGNGQVGLFSGLWMDTAAVTSVALTITGDIAQHSTLALYGVKAP